MSELQAKLLVVAMFFSGFMAYAWPKMQEIKQCHDAVVSIVGRAGPAPAPGAPTTVHKN
jgi:hypothetical protein